jgi:clan AA aspartic protease
LCKKTKRGGQCEAQSADFLCVPLENWSTLCYHTVGAFDCGRKIMGHVYADITLENCGDADLAQQGDIPPENVRKMKVNAMVDSGAMTLTINEEIAHQLGLRVRKRQEVVLADGSFRRCDYAGPVYVHFENRLACCLALVLPGADEVLLGVIPLEEMDVIIDPITQKLAVHPERPLMAQMKIK